MAWKVDERIPEEMFVQLLAKKANIIKDHLQNSHSKLTIVANIGPTMPTFKLYDLSEEDSLKLHITLSNLGDIDEQIHQLWQQVNFLLKQYCSHVSIKILKRTIQMIHNYKNSKYDLNNLFLRNIVS